MLKGIDVSVWQGSIDWSKTKDEIDFAIKDIQNTNRRVILESTGLQAQLEEMREQISKEDNSDEIDV